MNIVTWNAGRGQASLKLPLVMDAYEPDLLAVQEISDMPGRDHLWTGVAGGKSNQGVLLRARPPYRLKRLEVAFRSSLYLAAEVYYGEQHVLNVLNVWVKPFGSKSLKGYVDSLEAALEDSWDLLSSKPLVMLGDFNYLSEEQVEFLEGSSGLLNAYHDFFELETAEYPHFTHRHRTSGSEVHWDYCYLPDFWRSGLAAVEVGAPDIWLKHSDHCPVLVRVQDSVVKRGRVGQSSREDQAKALPLLIQELSRCTKNTPYLSWTFDKEQAAEVRRLVPALEESGLSVYVNMATRIIEIDYPV